MFGIAPLAGVPFASLEGYVALTGDWNLIDNSGVTYWQNVYNAQSSGWSVIADEQTPSWVLIPT
jgi:hypothetical protein